MNDDLLFSSITDKPSVDGDAESNPDAEGGGAFFGKVGSFEEGYEFDAVVMDDSVLPHPQSLNLEERMERAVGAPASGDHFKIPQEGEAIAPEFKNKTSLPISEKTMNVALASFYETTGISMSLVVVDIADVFEKGLDFSTIIMLVFGVILLIVAIVLIVRAIKSKKDGGNGGNGGGANYNGQGDPRYNPYSNVRF